MGLRYVVTAAYHNRILCTLLADVNLYQVNYCVKGERSYPDVMVADVTDMPTVTAPTSYKYFPYETN